MLARGETVNVSYSTGAGATGGSMSTYSPDGSFRSLTSNEQFILTDLIAYVVSTGALEIWGSSTLSTAPLLVFSSTDESWHTGFEGMAFPVGTYPWVVGAGTTRVILGGTGYIIKAGGWVSQPSFYAGANAAGIAT